MMEGQIVKLCGAGIICAVCALILKRSKCDFSFGISIGALIIFFFFVMGVIEPILAEISDLFSLADISELLSPIIKALGVAILAQLSAGICQDCGEGGIAQGIELAAKLEILLISLPLIKNIIGYAVELISLQ